MTNVRVEGVHDEGHMVKEVELPAFPDKTVAQDILEGQSVLVGLFGEVTNPGELERRRENSFLGCPLTLVGRAYGPRQRVGSGNVCSLTLEGTFHGVHDWILCD